MTHFKKGGNFMSEQTKEFGLFIDSLRTDRQMSREDLCDGIISLSQYKRYLRGAASIPNNKLLQLADRLNLSISEIHLLFQKEYNKQYSDILNIYQLMKKNEYEEAYNLAREFAQTPILSSYNTLFFDYCMINIQHKLKKATDIQALELYSKLVDFPECKNTETFNWIEINVLIEIVKISSKMGNNTAMDMVYNILISEDLNVSSSSDKFFLPSVYSTLSQILGKNDKYKEIIELTNKGIQYSRYHEISNALSQLFLLNSFANYDLNNMEDAIESAKKGFMQLYIENKPDMFKLYKKIFENKFNMKVSELIKID